MRLPRIMMRFARDDDHECLFHIQVSLARPNVHRAAWLTIRRYKAAVVRLMPPTVGGDNQYRIKSLSDGHERVVKESDLMEHPAG